MAWTPSVWWRGIDRRCSSGSEHVTACNLFRRSGMERPHRLLLAVDLPGSCAPKWPNREPGGEFSVSPTGKTWVPLCRCGADRRLGLSQRSQLQAAGKPGAHGVPGRQGLPAKGFKLRGSRLRLTPPSFRDVPFSTLASRLRHDRHRVAPQAALPDASSAAIGFP